jgi:hypothetical protein
VLTVLLFGPQAASAQSCINEVWQAHNNKQNVTCTANDVTLSSATNIQISTGGDCNAATGICRCFSGQPLTFSADFQMDLTADTRYDVGFYLATDGDPNSDGAITGQCSATASTAANTINFRNLDASPDLCGDITGPFNSAFNPLLVRATINTTCPTGAGQQLQLPFATTWRQPGSNQLCSGTGNGTTTNDVFPGSPSKCNTGVLALNIFSAPVEFTVTKDALTDNVDETGGSATYNVKVKNDSTTSALTVTSLTDNKYGNITTTHAAGGGFLAVTTTTCVADANAATCEVGGSIAAGAECSCTFTGTVPPGDFPGSFTDTVTACGNNIFTTTAVCHTDDATVPYKDVEQPPTVTKTVGNQQCQIDVQYNIVVTNGSAQDTLTLQTLSDDKYGIITATHAATGSVGAVITTDCAVSQTIAPSGNYSCSFVGRMTSCDATLTDIVTAGASDDDGAGYSVTGTATIVVSTTP